MWVASAWVDNVFMACAAMINPSTLRMRNISLYMHFLVQATASALPVAKFMH